jgi:hypothetical protein
MSDSLKETVIVIVLVLTICTNGELLVDDEDVLVEPEEPVELEPMLPAVLVEAPVDEPDVDPVDAPDVPPVDPAETLSPADRLASDATVPLIGA